MAWTECSSSRRSRTASPRLGELSTFGPKRRTSRWMTTQDSAYENWHRVFSSVCAPPHHCHESLCLKRKGQEVSMQDIRKVYSLFVDVKRSTQFLVDYQNDFMFSELEGEEDGDVPMEETMD